MVSIIVPVYNCEKYLIKCVDSLRNQTYKNLQIILINDGSTDNSPEICDSIAEKDSRVAVIHKKNEGVSAARNDGMKFAQGEHLMFVDSDDMLLENAVEKAILDMSDTVDLVTFGHRQIDTNGNVLLEEKYDDLCIGIDNFRKDIWQYRGKISYSCMRLYKAEIINGFKIRYNENIKYCEDTLFVLDYLSRCKNIDFSSNIGYLYLRHPEQTITSYIENHFEQALFAHRQIKKFCGDKDISQKEAEVLFSLFFNALLNLFFGKLKFEFRIKKIKEYLSTEEINTSIKTFKGTESKGLFDRAQNAFRVISKTKNPYLIYLTAKFLVFLRNKVLGKA